MASVLQPSSHRSSGHGLPSGLGCYTWCHAGILQQAARPAEDPEDADRQKAPASWDVLTICEVSSRSSSDSKVSCSAEGVISISLHLASGKYVLSNFQVSLEDPVSSIQAAALLAHPCPPGYQLYLKLEDADLVQKDRIGDVGLQDGCCILGILSHSAEVETMLKHFERTNQLLRDITKEEVDEEPPVFFSKQKKEFLQPMTDLQMLCREATSTGVSFRDWGPAPAEPFERFLEDDCWRVRQLAIWSAGRLQGAGLKLVPQLQAALISGVEGIRLEAAASLQRLAWIDAALVMPILVEALGTGDLKVRKSICRWLRLLEIADLPEAQKAVPRLIQLVKEDGVDLCLKILAMPALRVLDFEALRKALWNDDKDAWAAAEESLDSRLTEACARAEAFRQDHFARELERIRDQQHAHDSEFDEQESAFFQGRVGATEVALPKKAGEFKMGMEKMQAAMRSEAARRLQASASASLRWDVNDLEFPVRMGFEPESLRKEMHENPHMYVATVEGEAAWQTLPMNVIKDDTLAPCQQNKEPCTLDEAAVQRRLTELRFYFSANRFGRHFFDKLTKIEGCDPIHSWLFPIKEQKPQQDFIPFHVESPPCPDDYWVLPLGFLHLLPD